MFENLQQRLEPIATLPLNCPGQGHGSVGNSGHGSVGDSGGVSVVVRSLVSVVVKSSD